MSGYRGRHGRRSGHGDEGRTLDGTLDGPLDGEPARLNGHGLPVQFAQDVERDVAPRRSLLELQPLVHSLNPLRHLVPRVPHRGVTRRAYRDVVLFTRETIRLFRLFVRLPVSHAGESEREDDDCGVSHGSLPFLFVLPDVHLKLSGLNDSPPETGGAFHEADEFVARHGRFAGRAEAARIHEVRVHELPAARDAVAERGYATNLVRGVLF